MGTFHLTDKISASVSHMHKQLMLEKTFVALIITLQKQWQIRIWKVKPLQVSFLENVREKHVN